MDENQIILSSNKSFGYHLLNEEWTLFSKNGNEWNIRTTDDLPKIKFRNLSYCVIPWMDVHPKCKIGEFFMNGKFFTATGSRENLNDEFKYYYDDPSQYIDDYDEFEE